MHGLREKEEFLQQVSSNKGIILKICNSFCRRASDREDLAQEIIYHLWKGRESFDPRFKFTTWMYRVALNVAITLQRADRRRSQTEFTEDGFAEVTDTGPPPGEERSDLLHRHVAGLKDLDRALIVLYFEEKSYREIAEVLGISETNVATKVSRIKERLKQAIQQN